MNIKNMECQPIKPSLNFGSVKTNAKPVVKREEKVIQELTNKQFMKFALSSSGIVIGLFLMIICLYQKNGNAQKKIKTGINTVLKKPLLMLENKKSILTPNKPVLMLENLIEKRNFVYTPIFDVKKIRLVPS